MEHSIKEVKNHIRIDIKGLTIGKLQFNPRKIMVIGFGKASYLTAKAIREVLNDKIDYGVI